MLKHLRATKDWDDKNALEKGFTLVELLVVIVILGILAAVVIFSVSGISDRGQDSACEADVTTFRAQIEAYRAQEGHEGSDTPTEAVLDAAGFNESDLWNLDPAAGSAGYVGYSAAGGEPQFVAQTTAGATPCSGVTP